MGRSQSRDQPLNARPLSSIVPEGIFVGTSLILRRGSRFLYGIRPGKEMAGGTVLEFTGIGGSLEAEDASYTEGVLREAREEIDCDVSLIPCEETVVVRGRATVERLRISGPERPAAVVFRHHRTPAHRPWHPDHRDEGCLIVFLGEIKGRPRPAMELPNLAWLHPEHILEIARQDVPLGELLDGGVELIPGPAGMPPTDGLARLTDSQEALALAMGDQTVDFYQSLGQSTGTIQALFASNQDR